jgi:hypothetical protein
MDSKEFCFQHLMSDSTGIGSDSVENFKCNHSFVDITMLNIHTNDSKNYYEITSL